MTNPMEELRLKILNDVRDEVDMLEVKVKIDLLQFFISVAESEIQRLKGEK